MTEPIQVHVARAGFPDVPVGEGWLAPTEMQVQSQLRFARRVRDWRLGRWVAKAAVAAALGTDRDRPEDIEVLAEPNGAPAARVLSDPSAGPVSLSLSHSGGIGFAVAASADIELGCDIETMDARSDAFVTDYFTAVERDWIRAGGSESSLRANVLWSAKESALKALGEGLRLDTRSVEAVAAAPTDPDAAAWSQLAVHVRDGRTFHGLWRVLDERAWTVVAGEPIQLVQEPTTPAA